MHHKIKMSKVRLFTFIFVLIFYVIFNVYHTNRKISLQQAKIGAIDTAISTYKSERKQILISVNMHGPNNQIWGFRESLFLANITNRLFIPSPIFKHYTIKKNSYMDPSAVVDLDILSRLGKI